MEINHSDMVRTLAKDGQKLIDQLTPNTAHALHMAVGISGEVAELLNAIVNDDRDNCLEELGDIEFYFEGLSQVTCALIAHEPVDMFSIKTDPMPDVLIMAGEILDLCKKIAVYNDHTKWDKLEIEMQRFRTALDKFYAAAEFTHEQALTANINKLGKRYEGFVYSDEAAQKRADKVEGE